MRVACGVGVQSQCDCSGVVLPPLCRRCCCCCGGAVALRAALVDVS